jgi:hypothetical protein
MVSYLSKMVFQLLKMMEILLELSLKRITKTNTNTMPKSLPQLGDSNWGTPLNNHLAQLQNPTTGGVNSFDIFSDRPLASTLTNDDKGKTYLYTQTGNIHQWTGTTWKVLNESIINVKDYGAVGDGVVDDTVAIQTSINQITLFKNTTNINIPQGQYKVTGGINVPRGVKIKGAGKVLTTILHSANNVCFDNLTDADQSYTSTEFSDFSLQHGYTNNSNAIGILTGNSSFAVKFQNINVQGFNGGVGIELRNTNTWTESSIWENVVMIENKIGIKMTRTAGTESFGYTNMKEVLFVVAAGQIGLLVGAGCLLYHSHISLRGSQAAGSILVKVFGVLEKNYYEIMSEGFSVNDGSYLLDIDGGSVTGTGFIPQETFGNINRIVNGGNLSTYAGAFGGNFGIGLMTPQSQLDVVGNNGITVGGYGTHRGVMTFRSKSDGAYFNIQNSYQSGSVGNAVAKFGWGQGSSTINTPDQYTTMSMTVDNKVGIGTSNPKSKLAVVGLIEHADNATALAAGLAIGDFYRTGDMLKVVH